MTHANTVYVDFDDVLCETARGLAALAADLFGVRIGFEEIRFFDLERAFGISRAQWDELMRVAHADDFLLRLAPVHGAADGLATLSARGYNLAVVTGRPADTRAASTAWLARHGMPVAEILFVDKYGRQAQAEQASAISLDALRRRAFCLAVEDAPDTVRFLSAHTSVPLAVFERPWNRAELRRDAAALRPLHWCATWRDVVRLLPAVKTTLTCAGPRRAGGNPSGAAPISA